MAVTDVKVKVVYQKGMCAQGHKLGDEWTVGTSTPAGICNAAYCTLYPFIRVLQRGGQYEYPAGSGVTRIACPDGWNPVIFEMKAVPGTVRPGPKMPEGCGHIETLPK